MNNAKEQAEEYLNKYYTNDPEEEIIRDLLTELEKAEKEVTRWKSMHGKLSTANRELLDTLYEAGIANYKGGKG